jgi:hypothetical protein
MINRVNRLSQNDFGMTNDEARALFRLASNARARADACEPNSAAIEAPSMGALILIPVLTCYTVCHVAEKNLQNPFGDDDMLDTAWSAFEPHPEA